MMKAAQQQVGGGGAGSNGNLSHGNTVSTPQMSPSDSDASPSPDGSQHGGYGAGNGQMHGGQPGGQMGHNTNGLAATPVSDMSPPPPTLLTGSPPPHHLQNTGWDIKPLQMGGGGVGGVGVDPSLQMGPGSYIPYPWYHQSNAPSMNQGLLT